MRVPIPLVIFLCLAVIVGFWIHGTRHMDFMTPPPESKLQEIRSRAEGPPVVVDPKPQTEIPKAPPREKPTISLGNPDGPPTLQEYSEVTPRTGAHLTEMARQLEAGGQAVRALLAWERVLDLARSDPAQIDTAIKEIRRLRPKLPDWNTDPANAIRITLHASTAARNVDSIKPAIARVAQEMEKASAGILKVTAEVASGRNPSASKSKPPVALWISGPDRESSSTEVISFTAGSQETLESKALKNVFELIRNFLARENSANPVPPGLSAEGDAATALHSHVTRLTWQNFGRLLNHPASHDR